MKLQLDSIEEVHELNEALNNKWSTLNNRLIYASSESTQEKIRNKLKIIDMMKNRLLIIMDEISKENNKPKAKL